MQHDAHVRATIRHVRHTRQRLRTVKVRERGTNRLVPVWTDPCFADLRNLLHNCVASRREFYSREDDGSVSLS